MKDWQNIFKSYDESEYKGFLSILLNYRVISTIKTKKCYNGKCVVNHKMVLKCTSKKCGECQVQYRSMECHKTKKYFVDKLSL